MAFKKYVKIGRPVATVSKTSGLIWLSMAITKLFTITNGDRCDIYYDEDLWLIGIKVCNTGDFKFTIRKQGGSSLACRGFIEQVLGKADRIVHLIASTELNEDGLIVLSKDTKKEVSE